MTLIIFLFSRETRFCAPGAIGVGGRFSILFLLAVKKLTEPSALSH